MKARMLILYLVVSLFFVPSTPAYAESINADLNAKFAPGADGKSAYLSTSVNISKIGSKAGSKGTNGSAYKLSPLIYSFSYLPMLPGEICGDDPEALSAMAVLTNRSTGEVVKTMPFCMSAQQKWPVNMAVPPTYAQIWNALYSEGFTDESISSGAYVAPQSPGLTGLPTHIWTTFPGGQTISRDISFDGGYHLTATAKLSEVTILSKLTSGKTEILATLKPSFSGQINGGSFEDPVAVHKFSTAGTYVISTAITWNANNAVLTGPTLSSPLVVPLGSLRLEINRDYEVNELRPVVTK